MSEVTKKSDNSSSQMRLLGGTPHLSLLSKKIRIKNMVLVELNLPSQAWCDESGGGVAQGPGVLRLICQIRADSSPAGRSCRHRHHGD